MRYSIFRFSHFYFNRELSVAVVLRLKSVIGTRFSRFFGELCHDGEGERKRERERERKREREGGH